MSPEKLGALVAIAIRPLLTRISELETNAAQQRQIMAALQQSYLDEVRMREKHPLNHATRHEPRH